MLNPPPANNTAKRRGKRLVHSSCQAMLSPWINAVKERCPTPTNKEIRLSINSTSNNFFKVNLKRQNSMKEIGPSRDLDKAIRTHKVNGEPCSPLTRYT